MVDFYWLAGLFEGEAAFTWSGGKNGSRKGATPYITITSTDLDVIEKVHRIVGSTQKIVVRKRVSARHKQAYQVQIIGRRAIGWMMMLYPFMSNRRKDRIKEIISDWKLIKPRMTQM